LRPLPNLPLKGGLDWELHHLFLCHHFFLNLSALTAAFFPCHATSHPHLFHPSIANESEIRKLVASFLLLDREVLQWCPATSEDIPTPNTNETVVFTSFFQRGFGHPACDFLRDLLVHNQIELVHLNPNSILHIVIFCSSL
jgi:hypothetical protein